MDFENAGVQNRAGAISNELGDLLIFPGVS